MDINLVWDSSVSDAPAGFETAVEAAADYLDGLITNNITVNIDVGWGEVDGQSLGADALGEGGPFIYGAGMTYAQVKSTLTANASSPAQETAVANLPATDPTGGGTFYLSAAQEKAFGLTPAGGTEIDGAVGFSSTADWDYSTTDRSVAGEYDLVGDAEHELTHALGRMYGLGDLYGPDNYTVLDLYRYAAPGSLELTAGAPSYFSINGGTTDLANFSTVDDDGDWASTNGPDSFDAFDNPGTEQPVTKVDITELNVLGFNVACFLRGSRVLTPHGVRAVEHLAVGGRVLTADGRIAPIMWIGERRTDCRAHPAPEKVWPVRIRAGAFAANKPARDLLLSPDHAVYVADGGRAVLVPVQHLVNGATIVQEPEHCAHYFHLELDRHDILLAEGLEVESYLDTGNRVLFANAAAAPAAHPDADSCAPLCTAGDEVVAARRRLFERALQLGHRIDPAVDIRVVADGRPAAAGAIEGARRRFLLPPKAREIRIRTAGGVPAWTDPASGDRRRLGVSVGGIWLDGEPVPLDSAALAGGFHPIERSAAASWRWTDGAAMLLVPPADRPRVLDLLTLDVMRGWVMGSWAAAEPDTPSLAA